MSIKQKFYIGGFLTVNVWLIIIALVRITSFKQGQTFDFIWNMFFQFFESNVAILAACFSAFRSLFVNNSSERGVRHHRPIQSFGGRFLGKNSGHHRLDDLPSVPGPTVKGMRTMIWQSNRTKASDFSNDDTASGPTTEGVDEASLGQGSHDRGNEILVEHDWSIESTRVSHLHCNFNLIDVLIIFDRSPHNLLMEHQRGNSWDRTREMFYGKSFSSDRKIILQYFA